MSLIHCLSPHYNKIKSRRNERFQRKIHKYIRQYPNIYNNLDLRTQLEI